jgi:hypothetical protein
MHDLKIPFDNGRNICLVKCLIQHVAVAAPVPAEDQDYALTVSYDTSAILQDYTARHHIAFPLLTDSDSEIIRAYGVLNGKATGFSKGMAVPAYFYIGPDGLIREKYFETDYTDLYTAKQRTVEDLSAVGQTHGRSGGQPAHPIDSPAVGSSGDSRQPFYAYGRGGPAAECACLCSGCEELQTHSTDFESYPRTETGAAPVSEIKGLVPAGHSGVGAGFRWQFRISEDAVVSAGDEFVASLGAGRTVSVHGTLRYQVCDSNKCYLPEKAKVLWEV